jgi:hypothetical protein
MLLSSHGQSSRCSFFPSFCSFLLWSLFSFTGLTHTVMNIDTDTWIS